MSDATQIASPKARNRCAVYCRVSSDEQIDQEFNSIDAQKEAGHAYVASQRAEGWIPVADVYDEPGFSGGNTERPGLKRLMADIERGQIGIVVVYKIDRLTRSLADLSKMVEVFERHGVSFVSPGKGYERLPAPEIEGAAVAQIRTVLTSPETVASVVRHIQRNGAQIDEATTVMAMGRLNNVWDQLFPVERHRIANQMIERIDLVHAGEVQGIKVKWREVGWNALIKEFAPASIGAELLEVEA